MLMVFSAASIGVEAAYSPYKDDAIQSYDSIDKPILTTDQYASMAMDEIDRMLAEANLLVSFDLAGILSIEADFSSLDKALLSIQDVYKKAKPLLGTIKGDVENIDFTALVDLDGNLTCPMRDDDGATDLDIFLHVFQFLADNAEIVAKVPYGSVKADSRGLDLGIIAGFVDLDELLDFNELIKKPIAKLVWPDATKQEINAELENPHTIDEYIEIFINDLCAGTYSKNKSHTLNDLSDAIQYYVPGINEQIDLLNDSVYDIIEAALRIAIVSIGIPMANEYLPVAIGKLCGFGYDKEELENGMTKYTRNPAKDDPSNGLENLVNTEFELADDCIDPSTWGSESFMDHMNEICGVIVKEALNPAIIARVPNNGWNFNGGNELLDDNIIAIARVVLEDFAEELFSSYVEVLPAEEVEAMNDQELVAYMLRSIFNGSITSCDIESDADTVLEVLFELVRNNNAEMVPSQNYAGDEATMDNIIQMLLDLAVVGLNQITNMNLSFGMDEEEFAEAAMDWVIENYGGFVSEIEGSGWDAASYVIFHIIPANWLPYDEDGNERDSIRSIAFDDLVGNILDFDLAGVLSLLGINEDGELNGTIIEVLLARIAAIINYIIPGTFPEKDDVYTYDSLEGLLNRDLLSDVFYGLLTGLNERVQNGNLAASLLPLLCSILDLSSPEEFDYPYVSLDDAEVLDPTRAATFYMYNGSSGINTNATDKYGNTPDTPDRLYTYRINSVTTNMDGVTVSPSSNITINGGTSQTFTINGDLAAIAAQQGKHDSMFDGEAGITKVLKVTINYDVLEESGNVMTPAPLTATSYCYISSAADDGSTRTKKDATSDNMHLIYLNQAKYMSVKDGIGDVEDITVDLQRNVSSNSNTHTLDAVFKANTVTVDANLAALGVEANLPFQVSTTKGGGTWEYKPFVVTDRTAELEEGLYTNNLAFQASKTASVNESISFPQYIYVYNDWGLPGLLSNAINANRQEANYDTGDHEAEYVDFYNEDKDNPNMCSETVNGADAWERYQAAVEAAVEVVYRPRLVNSFEYTHAAWYEELAYELYTATQELEACSVSSGASGVKAVLDSIIVPDTFINEKGEEEEYDYDSELRTYFGREDYVSYTYSNFKEARDDAKDLISDDAKGKSIPSIKAAYIQHRLELYAGRLIRVIAYKTHLNEAINKYAPIYQAGQGNYSADSWAKFTRAYDFATAVNAEALGTRVASDSENLEGDGLRQTKVNEARAQLIKAAKRLVESNLADYTQLNAAIANAKATYEAGSTGYTAVSWATFAEKYEAALSIVAQQLEASTENQATIDNAATALNNAFGALETAQAGGWEFNDQGYLNLVTVEGYDTTFLVGLDDWGPFIDGLVDTFGGYTVEYTLNDYYQGSTGSYITIYDDKGNVDAEFCAVFYGDIDGDGGWGSSDNAVLVVAMAGNGVYDWEYYWDVTDFAQSMAADINHDGTLGSGDVATMLQVINYEVTPNQSYASFDDPVFL